MLEHWSIGNIEYVYQKGVKVEKVLDTIGSGDYF